MILIEFLIVLVALITCLISILKLGSLTLKSPLLESKIMLFGIILTTLAFFSYLLSAYMHDPGSSVDLGVDFFRIGIFLALAGTSIWASSFIIAGFSASYYSIMTLNSILVIFISSGIINFFTITQTVENGRITINYHPFGLLTLILGVIIFLISFNNRLNQIIEYSKRKDSIFIEIKSRVIFGFLFLSAVVTLVIFPLFPQLNLPGFSWLIPFSLVILYFSYIYSKDVGFWFTTPAKLFAIVIIDKDSGIEYYIKAFDEEIIDAEFLGSFFKAIDITIRETIKTSRYLEQISYGDKVVLLYESEHTLLFSIVSENNLVASSITKYLAKSFEKRYFSDSQVLKSKLINKEDYKEFDETIKVIRPYIPL
jgi:hypothetical protein